MTPPRHIPHVLLLVETSLAYGRGIVEGITRYALENGPWSVQFEARGLDAMPPKWLKNWRGDGIISRTLTLQAAKMLKATHLPMVEMLGNPKTGIAQVRGDFSAMGEMVADHLLMIGLRRFAFFTYAETLFIKELGDAFRQALQKRGLDCLSFDTPRTGEIFAHWDERQRPSMAKWLLTLPRPIAIYTPGDSHAVQLLNSCRELNIAVPEEMAILGSGNDPVICETVRPTLSSLDFDAKRTGYEAARLLDRKMAGEEASETIQIPPSHIEVRQSTDVTVIDDPDIVQAMRFIREYACAGIDIARVAEEVGMSLSVLQRRFRKYLGRTPKSEILRIQIGHAKKLLSQTDKSCAIVAKRCGFHSLPYFTRAFKRETGMTPNTFRSIDRS
jgi:LacI family transcriptional regulator